MQKDYILKKKCLKIILYLTQGGYTIWRTKNMLYILQEIPYSFDKGTLDKKSLYTQNNPILKFEMRV